jgi:membrane protein DedA with SNARE-associated domain
MFGNGEWITSSHAVTLFFGIILLSYLLEDLAIVTAALVASDDLLIMPLALLAIFIGIASGDLALYWLGKVAHRSRCLRYRLLRHKSMKVIRQKLSLQAFGNIFVIRFVPGLRAVGYSLSGFFHISLWQFLLAVMLATAVWVGVVFTVIYQLGSASWLVDTPYKWFLAPLALLVLWALNARAKKPSASSQA